ncbi:MAG: beta-glucosidase [Janthinobacterium lividum]
MRNSRCFALLLCCSFGPAFLRAQAVPAETADNARIERLLQQMTLEEKVNLIRGGIENPATYQGQAGYLPGVPRLHVPSLRMADGPPGVLTRVPGQAETATMGVAATFSVKDAEANGVVIGRDARSLGIDVILQPFINIDRDLTFARGYNTFGEDPFLTGMMGAAEIRGAQSQGVMAQAKHYIAYDSDSYDITVDPQTLHEVYVAPFVEAIKAGVSSVMCSYNRVNGAFACGNADTLKEILKTELGFKGFVTSDWGGTHSALFLNQGLDMEMPGIQPPNSPMAALIHTYFATSPPPPAGPAKLDAEALAGMLGGTIPEEPNTATMDMNAFPRDADETTLGKAVANGTISEATVTAAARRVLYEMDRFGYLDGKQKHNITPQDIEANAAVIRHTAQDAAVLLKNEAALPLSAKDLSSVALIGPGAGQVMAIGAFGERSPGLPNRQVSPLAALKQAAPNAHITFAVDDDMTGKPVPSSMLSHDGKPGMLRTSGGNTTVDRSLDFTNTNQKALPPNAEISWRGTLTVPSAGDYWMYLQVLGARGVMKIDGKELGRTGAMKGTVHGDIQHASQDNGIPTTDGLDNVRRIAHLAQGAHQIEVTSSGDTSNAPEQIRLNWVTPEMRQENHDAAIEAAKQAHTAVVFLWTRGKPAFHLPGEQDKLVEDIAAVNPNTVVVLNTSQPIAMPWIGKVKAVLEMWWPGDEGGWATADLLMGKANPAGRLPFTWAKRLEDYPATDPAHPERSSKGVAGKTTYSEGVDVGYRWFEAQHVDPLFPFGFGLSYTNFAYSGLQVAPASDGGLDVHFNVQNKGSVRGDEVSQVYLDAPLNRPTGAQFAPQTLAGFDRISLDPGQTQSVTIHVPSRSLEYWSVAQNHWVRAADRTVHVGSSSRNLPLRAEAK